MKNRWIVLTSLALIACATAEFPAEVSAFVERRDICDHLRGEISGEPTGEEQGKEQAAQLDKYCKGTDNELSTLKQRYAGSQRIMDRLSTYESRIEPRRR
jgi:hypothetical protein